MLVIADSHPLARREAGSIDETNEILALCATGAGVNITDAAVAVAVAEFSPPGRAWLSYPSPTSSH